MTLTCMSGMQTLLASWEVYADGAPGATVLRLKGLAAAVFPNEPARAVYNNAVLERIAVLSSVPDAVDRWRRRARRRRSRGACRWTTSACRRPWSSSHHRTGRTTRAFLPPWLLSGADPSAFHVLIACLDAERVAAGWRSISTAIAGSTTWEPWSMPGGAVWAPH
jgi:hypothetical protein